MLICILVCYPLFGIRTIGDIFIQSGERRANVPVKGEKGNARCGTHSNDFGKKTSHQDSMNEKS